MITKNAITAIITIGLFQLRVDSFCIPCPTQGTSIFSLTSCNCSLPKYHDETTNKCIPYSECPVLPVGDLPVLKMPTPFLHDVSSNASDANEPPKTPVSKDITLVIKAIKKRLEKVQSKIPEFLQNFLQSILLKNTNQLFGKCRGNMICVIQEMTNGNNKDLIISQLKSVRNEVDKTLYGVFDDMSEVLKENCLEGECLLLREILKWKKVIPERFEEFRDLQEIVEFFIKYFLGEFKQGIKKRFGFIKQIEKGNVGFES